MKAIAKLRSIDPHLTDRALALVLAALAQVELWVTHSIEGPKALTVPISLSMTLPLAYRRTAPLLVASAVLGSEASNELVHGPQSSVTLLVAWACAMYALAVYADARRFRIGLGVTLAWLAVGAASPNGDPRAAVAWVAGTLVGLVLVRYTVRTRELRADALQTRAELLEREQELKAREAVVEERARIARELHDVVAHSVSVIVVQAGAERLVLEPGQDSTREALLSIERTGRQALTEMRSLLEMLRRSDDEPALEPQPSLQHLDSLLEQVRAAGLPVELEVTGDPAPLPAGVDVSAYRIVQEALTNSLKHAGPAHASVAIRYGNGELELEVSDDGPGRPGSSGSGYGLVGMRERVALYGGELQAGRRDPRGFAVRARLPLEPARV